MISVNNFLKKSLTTSLIRIILLILLLTPNLALAQIPVPDNLTKTVSFLFTSDGTKLGAGTAFFVNLKDESNGLYIVTAKHVIQNSSGDYLSHVCMRVNTQRGALVVPIRLSGENPARVFVHPNSDVDIAVIPGVDISVLPKGVVGDYDFFTLDSSLLVTKEHFNKGDIKEGDEVFFTGWFRNFYGAKRNYPISRFGRLAMIPQEKIPWDNKMLDLYLIEAHASGGNSGSPVFFRPTVQRAPATFVLGRPTLLLAGILKGYFRDIGTNSGIAAVVPANLLHEILYSDAAKKQRESSSKPSSLDVGAFGGCSELEERIRKTLKQ